MVSKKRFQSQRLRIVLFICASLPLIFVFVVPASEKVDNSSKAQSIRAVKDQKKREPIASQPSTTKDHFKKAVKAHLDSKPSFSETKGPEKRLPKSALLKASRKTSKDAFEVLLRKSNKLIAAGKFAEVKDIYIEILKSSPEKTSTAPDLIAAQIREKLPKEIGAEIMQDLADNFLENRVVSLEAAHLFLDYGDKDKATYFIDMSEGSFADYKHSRKLAGLLSDLGSDERALAVRLQAIDHELSRHGASIKANPNLGLARIDTASQLIAMGEYSRAQEMIDALIGEVPTSQIEELMEMLASPRPMY